jgi:hypothetical protein
VPREDVACLGGDHASGVSFEQWVTDLALEPEQLLGDSRRRVGQRLGCCCHGPRLDDMKENAESPDIQHEDSFD